MENRPSTFSREIAAFLISCGIAIFMFMALNYAGSQWTAVSMRQVADQYGDQNVYKNQLFQWSVVTLLIWVAGLVGIGVTWWKALGSRILNGAGLLSILLILLAGCGTNTVFITPPNYAIVINMTQITEQVQANDFERGEVQIGQITVGTNQCGTQRCPDKMIVEVGGAPESRMYTRDPNTGTSATNQSLCFAASGSNGCLDFSVDAVIRPEDVKCYANKVGTSPVNGSNFYHHAKPLGDALDTKVVQTANSVFATHTIGVNPLQMETKKFEIFDEVRPLIIKEVYEQTCITLTDIAIIGGVGWESPEVQEVIDQATVSAAQAEIDMNRTNNTIAQMKALEAQFGREAALELMAIQRWDGKGYPLPLERMDNQSPVTAVPVAPTAAPAP